MSPLSFCAMNVALYHRSASAWCLEETVVHERDRGPSSLGIGMSEMHWNGDALVIDIDERTTPLWSPVRDPVRGRVVLHPETLSGLELDIDRRGQHRWWPVAPLARIEVDLDHPGLRFSGHGYLDANAGEVPLESTFEQWSWSRARTSAGAILTYDVAEVDGRRSSLAFCTSPSARRDDLHVTHDASLGPTVWGLERPCAADHGARPRVVRSLEDGPFYARSLVDTELGGHRTLAMHEALALHRLRRAWVQVAAANRMRLAR